MVKIQRDMAELKMSRTMAQNEDTTNRPAGLRGTSQDGDDKMTTRDKIKAVLDQHPRLTTGGFMPRYHADIADRCTHFLTDNTAAQFEASCHFIAAAGTTQNATRKSHYSYHLKHIAERWADTYIANGAFIAAALYMGAPVLPDGGMSPNACIGLSKPGVAKIAKETNDRRDAEYLQRK